MLWRHLAVTTLNHPLPIVISSAAGSSANADDPAESRNLLFRSHRGLAHPLSLPVVRAGAPSLSLRSLQGQGGDFGFGSILSEGDQIPRPVAENATRTGHPSRVKIREKGWASLPMNVTKLLNPLALCPNTEIITRRHFRPYQFTGVGNPPSTSSSTVCF